MFNKYADLDSETLINHAARLMEYSKGSTLIYKIYKNTKNLIAYEANNKFQKASETLVMGRGNNFSKNVLLYSLLKISGFDCELRYKYVVDNTKIIACRNNINTPWFYVYVNYLGKKFELDCSFDRSFSRASGIIFTGDEMNCNLENYLSNKNKAFTVINRTNKEDESSILRTLSKKGNAQIYSRARGIGYV